MTLPSTMTDEKLAASLARTRKELTALDDRHSRAKATIGSYREDRAELTARLEYLTTIERNRKARLDDDVSAQPQMNAQAS